MIQVNPHGAGSSRLVTLIKLEVGSICGVLPEGVNPTHKREIR